VGQLFARLLPAPPLARDPLGVGLRLAPDRRRRGLGRLENGVNLVGDRCEGGG
jgi:hypothetical protein